VYLNFLDNVDLFVSDHIKKFALNFNSI